MSDVISSPAGSAPADAFEPLGEPVDRPLDCWVACDPLNPDEASLQRIEETLQGAPAEGHGLRLRFVKPDFKAAESILDLLPPLQEHIDRPWEFLHLELLSGPEPGIFLAVDNRKPALIVQQWIEHAGQEVDEALFSQGSLREGHPAHLNVHIHDLSSGLFDWSEEGVLRQVASRLQGNHTPLHQLTLVARSDEHPRGVSVGLEGITNEQGSTGQ